MDAGSNIPHTHHKQQERTGVHAEKRFAPTEQLSAAVAIAAVQCCCSCCGVRLTSGLDVQGGCKSQPTDTKYSQSQHMLT